MMKISNDAELEKPRILQKCHVLSANRKAELSWTARAKILFFLLHPSLGNRNKKKTARYYEVLEGIASTLSQNSFSLTANIETLRAWLKRPLIHK